MPTGKYFKTEDHRKNLSLALRGRKAWNKGLKLGPNPEHSKKMKGRKGNPKSINAMKNINKGKSRSKGVKDKISKSHKGMKKPWSSEYNSKRIGDKHPNWQGGITPEYSARFNTSIWKNIRKLVLQRDNYTCQKCKIRKKSLDVHHKKSWRFTKDDSSDNLISLCRKCHREEDSKLQRASKGKKRGEILYNEIKNA